MIVYVCINVSMDDHIRVFATKEMADEYAMDIYYQGGYVRVKRIEVEE